MVIKKEVKVYEEKFLCDICHEDMVTDGKFLNLTNPIYVYTCKNKSCTNFGIIFHKINLYPKIVYEEIVNEQ